MTIGRISIDSRTLAAGDFFVAIRGERFDGHQFVADALARGAAGVLRRHAAAGRHSGRDGAADGPVLIRAKRHDGALQAWRATFAAAPGARVVAITGSAGKTTTKEVTAEFLAPRYRVFRNKGNLNNHIGLPLSLLELRDKPDVAVVELGMNHPGEIRTLVGIAEPDVRVWTNVGDAHLGFFESPDAIADAKARDSRAAQRPTTLLVANANDRADHVARGSIRRPGSHVRHRRRLRTSRRAESKRSGSRARPRRFARRPVTRGSARRCSAWATSPTSSPRRPWRWSSASRFPTSSTSAATLRPASHRGELLRLPGGVTLMDDSYNSSPSALMRALETIGAATGSARKAAVLGEMLELGAHAERLHAECGRAAAGAGLDLAHHRRRRGRRMRWRPLQCRAGCRRAPWCTWRTAKRLPRWRSSACARATWSS